MLPAKTPSLPKAIVQIPAQELYAAPAVDFVLSFAARFSSDPALRTRLKVAVSSTLSMVLDNNAHGKSRENIALSICETQGRLIVKIKNRGIPILLSGGRSGINAAYFERFREASKHVDKLVIENSGRQGQTLLLETSLGADAAAKALGEDTGPGAAAVPENEALTFRTLLPDEAESLSRLFYLVYGYDYIDETVYYPEKLRARLASGELISIGAVRPNGRLIGHVGLVRKNETPPIYEAAMGVVDPAIKARGVFSELFDKTMETVGRTPMQYCLFDLVTNHDRSQKHVAKHGPCELALFIGCQSRQTQARLERIGLGCDPEQMDRYSLLVALKPCVPYPFGREVTLPESLGAPFGYLLKPLGLSWAPAPRFQALPAGGRFRATYQEAQSAVIFDLEQPGRQAAEQIIEQWRGLLRDGYQYAAVDVPLPAAATGQQPEGLKQLHDLLGSNGFFAAGFVPYRLSDRLGFRFQAIAPAKVAFDKIMLVTEPARALLKLVRQDYEAGCLV